MLNQSNVEIVIDGCKSTQPCANVQIYKHLLTM